LRQALGGVSLSVFIHGLGWLLELDDTDFTLSILNRYSMPHNGHDRAPSWIPLRQLHQYFLLPWKQIINQVDTVMESYTEIDGVPNVANRYTLNRLLRKQLGFEGLVVTDYHEIDNLFEWHHTASDRADAVKKTLEEGTVDMSMIANDPDDFFRAMRSLNGTQFQSRVKASARRVLKLKQKLNMFEEAFLMENSTDDYGPTQDDLIEALRMTTESIILAQNNDEVLPLDSNAPLKVLVTGPTSRSRSFQTGGWTYQWQGVDSNKEDQWFTYGSTVYDAMNIGSWEVSYKCGVDILGQDCQEDDALDDQEEQDDGIVDTMKGWVGWRDDDSDRLSIERAMDQAKDTDVIIVCIGEENYAEKPGDIRSSRLPAGQYELVAGLRQAAPDAKIVAVVSEQNMISRNVNDS
jgi:beta-glucosidase